MRAIYKKELKSYFTSAIAWVFLAFFLVLTGLFFFLYNLSGGSLNFSTVYGAIEIFLYSAPDSGTYDEKYGGRETSENGPVVIYVTNFD